jgi:hypothetical protein
MWLRVIAGFGLTIIIAAVVSIKQAVKWCALDGSR